MMRVAGWIAGAAVLGMGVAQAEPTPAPADAEAYIIWPHDGEVIRAGKLWVRMGLKNIGIAPAGIDKPNTGHHHLLIDAEPPPPGEPIPNDRNNLHFGGGQTEARLIELPPGEHTLQMVLGDHIHAPHDPPVTSDKVTINVLPYEPGVADGTSGAPYLYIGWPNDGEVIRGGRFRVWFGLRHMGVAPAGVEAPNTGHHHLLIDSDLPPPGEPIPNDRNHLHFGGGQTETTVELPPGEHTLQLVMGDHEHVPHDPPVVSPKITVTVQ